MKKKIILILLGVLIVAAIILADVLIMQDEDPKESEEQEEYLIDLGDDLYVLQLVNISGTFVEDGSDAKIDMVAAITVENRGDKTLQLANITLYVEGTEYAFSLTTLPPGEQAMIQETGKQTFPIMEELPGAKTSNVVFFQEEPSMHEDVFDITTEAYTITVENKTDTDIAGPIYVYYKTKGEDYYQGGITYRVQISGLEAGETYSAYAGHFYGEESQVMFVDYAE